MNRCAQFVFCVGSLLWASFASAVSFTASHYASGDTVTYSVTSGDFNNDGILDLVTINGATLSFYKGLSGGGFASPVNQTINPNLGNQVQSADFNRDGKLDLAISSNSNGPDGVIIYLGNGNGTFTKGTSVVTTGVPFYVALADFNGDHLPDLVASWCPTSNAPCGAQVFLGQGNGLFKQSAYLSYGGGAVVAGDFNADGRQDIAVLTNNELVMYLGAGNGTFNAPLLASENDPVGIAVGDFYNNRIQSVAVLTGVLETSGNFEYYINSARYSNGGISITSPQLINTNQFYHDIAAGDLNGDFKDDVVVVGGEKFGGGALANYLIGNGNGTFQSAAALTTYAEDEEKPFIRDINLDSRHDIGTAWTNGYMVTGGGPYVWMNTNAATNCTPPKPNALSVHICAPTSGQVVGQTFTFKAAGNAWNGIAKRMELWIDGKKIGQNLEDQLSVTTSLSRGSHTASFVTVDSFDHYVSQSVSFTASY